MSEVKVFAALRALDLLSRRWGEVDAHLMVCLEEASYTLATSGRAAEGAPLAGRIVEIRDALPVAARDPLLLANARRVHAWMLSMAGRCDEAEGVFLTAEREMIETLGEAHYLVALTRAQLAYCVLERGDVASAEAMSRAALETLVGTAISSTDQRAHGSFVRGRVLAAQGRHAEALELFETAWSSFYNVTPRENRWRMELLEGLSGSCEAAGDLAGAEGWRRVAAGG